MKLKQKLPSKRNKNWVCEVSLVVGVSSLYSVVEKIVALLSFQFEVEEWMGDKIDNETGWLTV